MREVFGVRISQVSILDLIHSLAEFLDTDFGSTTVCLVNTFSLVEAQKNPAHMANLKMAGIRLPDGWPVAALSGTKRIPGADLMLAVARDPRIQQFRHTLYGGFGVAYGAAVRQWLETGSPWRIAPPWMPEDEGYDWVSTINATKPDILWVALGCPKQEAWMIENRDKLTAKVIIGVGAAFNYLAGAVKRAPVWMQRCGLEGLYRIWAEPARWRRQIGAGFGLLRLLIRGGR